jgi:DNA-directed RNA polymerase specialized sigma24 family protein
MTGPEQYLHGPRGDRVVLLTQRTIDRLHRGGVLNRARALVKGQDPVADAQLVALLLAALETESGPRTNPVPTPERHRGSDELSTREAADRLNITTRAVTKACEEGRLQGRRDRDKRWWITPETLPDYQPRKKGIDR